MQSLRTRAILLLCLLIPAGATIAFLPKPGAPKKSEAWLQANAPKKIEDFHVAPYVDDMANPLPEGASTDNISYRMDEKTYETLKPFGIVCQVFRNVSKIFDAVIITSDSHQSFHDSKVCFQSQGWTLEAEKESTIETKSHGTIPVTIVDVKNERGSNKALLTYSGPNKVFRSGPGRMFRDMFFNQLRTGKISVCHFYRIIANYPGATEEELKEFAAKYIDAANASSGGYF